MNTYPYLKGFQTALAPDLHQFFRGMLHINGGPYGIVIGGAFLCGDQAEHGHELISDEFIQNAAVFKNDVHHGRKEFVQHGYDLFGRHPLGKRRKRPDIREKDGDLFPLIFK